MRLACVFLSILAALLVAIAGATGDLIGSDDLGYLAVAHAQAAGTWTPALHQFHGRLAATLPVAALLRAGVPEHVAWRLPGAAALVAVAWLLATLLARRVGPALALLATLAVVLDREVAEQAHLLGADLPAAALALAGLCVLLRWGRAPRWAALSGALLGLSLAAKETPAPGLAALACTLLISKVPRGRKAAWLAGLAAAGVAQLGAWLWLTGDPLFRLHAIEQGHNASVWTAPTTAAEHARGLAHAVTALAPVWLLVLAGGLAGGRMDRKLLAWMAGGVLGIACGSSSLTHAVRIPPLPRMFLPFAVVAPLALPRGTARSAPALAVIAALALVQLQRFPGPAFDPIETERAVVRMLARVDADPAHAALPIRTDVRTAALLAYLEPSLAPRVRVDGGDGPALILWSFRWIFFLHDAYGQPFPAGFLSPPRSLPLLARTIDPDRQVALAIGDGAEVRLQNGPSGAVSCR